MGFAAAGGEKVFKLTRERCLSGGGTGGTGGTRRANSRLRGYGRWDGWYQQAGRWDIGTPWSPSLYHPEGAFYLAVPPVPPVPPSWAGDSGAGAGTAAAIRWPGTFDRLSRLVQ